MQRIANPSMPVRVRLPPPTLLSGKHLALRSDDPFRWIAAPGWRMMLHSWGANGAHSGVRGGGGGGGGRGCVGGVGGGAGLRGGGGGARTGGPAGGAPPGGGGGGGGARGGSGGGGGGAPAGRGKGRLKVGPGKTPQVAAIGVAPEDDERAPIKPRFADGGGAAPLGTAGDADGDVLRQAAVMADARLGGEDDRAVMADVEA